MIEIIDGHSVDTSLLTGGCVLDAGARGFRFAREMASRGEWVTALEPDETDSHEPVKDIGRIHVKRAALIGGHWGWNGVGRTLEMLEDGEARRIVEGVPTIRPVKTVQAYDIQILTLQHCGEVPWDLVKLNIEGSEYDVLADWPGPIARQISVSFHEHTDRRRGDDGIQKIVAHLSQWYRPARHVKDERYCAGPNYWDSLFVRKDL